ncbi:MAG TPA: hypothetical protein VM490_01215 [Armatimonadaceae bacterium]|nr:hypothetical protein [Armatimonadaceae bacterium]
MKVALTLLVIGVLLLHQDTWNWTNKNLVFGFLPAGLAYHAFFSLLAAATMAVLVHFLWPAHLEDEESLRPATSPHTESAAATAGGGDEAR